MKLFAGIDGGQSSTIAVIGDESGTIVGRGVGGPCDEVGEPPGSRRFACALEDALANALSAAGLPAGSPFATIVAGISGYEGSIGGVVPDLRAERVVYVHDAPVAHAGAFDGGEGIVLVAGTGSVAYARNAAGDNVTVGGWGYLFGDEGSAFGLTRAALARAGLQADRGTQTAIARSAAEFFEAPDLRAAVRAIYAGPLDRVRLARFAPRVLELAEHGDPDATSVVDEATTALAWLAATCAMRVTFAKGAVSVALAGGTFASVYYRARVAQRIVANIPAARVQDPQKEPAAGALLLAYKEDRR